MTMTCTSHICSTNTTPFPHDSDSDHKIFDVKNYDTAVHELMPIPDVKNLTLRPSFHACIEKNYLMLLNESPRTTIEGRRSDIREVTPFARTERTPPPSPQCPHQSIFQQEDKVFLRQKYDLSRLQVPALKDPDVVFDSLPKSSNTNGSNQRATRDLSQTPLPKRIRLLPRNKRKKIVA